MSTGIQWTDRTRNFFLTMADVYGEKKLGWWCVKKSSGCARCYACAMNLMPQALASKRRRGNGVDYVLRGASDVEPVFDREALHSMLRWRGPYKIFPVDMSDWCLSVVFCRSCSWSTEVEANPMICRCPSCGSGDLKKLWPSSWIQETLDVFDELAAKGHKIQTLTKRTRRLRAELSLWYRRHGRRLHSAVWIGFSAETQADLDERWSDIHEVRRFTDGLSWMSYEPGLAQASFHKALSEGLGWGVIGGESGRMARPFDLGWAFDGIAQFRAFERPVYVKQVGARVFLPEGIQPVVGPSDQPQSWGNTWKLTQPAKGTTPDGWPERSLWKTGDNKGGNMNYWPMGMRIREFPAEVST